MPTKRCYPQSCANAHDISLCVGSTLAYLPAKPPLKGEVPALGGRRGSVPSAPQGRGGSVSRRDHNQAAGIRAQQTGATCQKEESPRPPATLRERGSGGEALLLEKRPLPQHLPAVIFSGGSAREGPFLQKRLLPRNHPHFILLLLSCFLGGRIEGLGLRGRRASLARGRRA